MRNAIGIGVSATALALVCVTAQARETPKRPPATPAPPAPSAERHGVAASYRTPTPGRGYSAQARHIADCLATYRDSYDPRTDKVALGRGVTRRCDL